MRRSAIYCLLAAVPTSCFSLPLSQKDACAQFSPAVVRIDAGGRSFGSGFIVSPDGYVMTANHVIRNDEDGGRYFSAIFVTLADSTIQPATPVTQETPEAVGDDYAILKIDSPKPLPYLHLGGPADVTPGADATIIGFPFSAISPEGTSVHTKFCLAATFAAIDSIKRTIQGTQTTRQGISQFSQNVKTDIIYFQGPSVKGISGSPVLSRETGNVVGIVSTKLTGITNGLDNIRRQAEKGAGSGGRVIIMGVDPTEFAIETVNVLDSQLANDLGSAVAIDPPKEALRKIQRGKRSP
jgi:S1-C subfamily serine protease